MGPYARLCEVGAGTAAYADSAKGGANPSVPALLLFNRVREAMTAILVNVADLRDPNDPQGRSYRQINAEKPHNIPIGALVELETGERLYVVHYGRDCDQTPLYGLSTREWSEEPNELIRRGKLFHGYGEESLTVVSFPSPTRENP